jgi:hypothetical protein
MPSFTTGVIVSELVAVLRLESVANKQSEQVAVFNQMGGWFGVEYAAKPISPLLQRMNDDLSVKGRCLTTARPAM